MAETVWVVLVQHADRSAWVDSAFFDWDSAYARAHQIEDEDHWLDAEVSRTFVGRVNPFERFL